jgi:hypothetical protein
LSVHYLPAAEPSNALTPGLVGALLAQKLTHSNGCIGA